MCPEYWVHDYIVWAQFSYRLTEDEKGIGHGSKNGEEKASNQTGIQYGEQKLASFGQALGSLQQTESIH